MKEQGAKKIIRKVREKKNRNRKAAIERKRNWVKKERKEGNLQRARENRKRE